MKTKQDAIHILKAENVEIEESREKLKRVWNFNDEWIKDLEQEILKDEELKVEAERLNYERD